MTHETISHNSTTNHSEELRHYVISRIEECGQESVDFIEIAKQSTDSAKVIKDLVNSSIVDEAVLASLIAKQIVSRIETDVDKNLKKYQKYTLNATSSDPNDSEFFKLISLLRDVSILGRKLLESGPQFNTYKSRNESMTSSFTSEDLIEKDSIVARHTKAKLDEDATSDDVLAALVESSSSDDFLILSSSLESISLREMIIAALIYIKSHECMTLSHDVQGVVMVLRRTKFMIMNILAPRNQMELITKLLTSIGRYSEMNYVFDLFRDRNQFEILLSKGVEKTSELRIALFNYVKRNPEFYPLVTLNFSMFREIAESLETSALKRLDKIIACGKNKKTFEEADSEPVASSSSRKIYSKDGLNLSLVELVDASDCFAKASCYKRSNSCEKKAKLIALQIALLPIDVNVLDLNQSELHDLIVNFESFSEAFIIADAYDHHSAWRHALFKNVILNGQVEYLDQFRKKCVLSIESINDIVAQYKQYTNSSDVNPSDVPRLAAALKEIFARLPYVELKCKLYTQLGFDLEELITDQSIRAAMLDLGY